ncbi:hypothetical protein HKX48_000975 [Thoreauomyces humboldtii]|nr:hypothetical protein HKX48_000975 [Thoreauomyces humboldtii]
MEDGAFGAAGPPEGSRSSTTFRNFLSHRRPPPLPAAAANLPPSVPRSLLLPSSVSATANRRKDNVDDEDDHDGGASLARKLHASRRSLNRPEFRHEAAALDRLRYKNTNQHRTTPYFRKLLAVRRLLARVAQHDLEPLLASLIADMHPNRTKRNLGRWERFPSRASITHSLLTLAGAYVLLHPLMDATVHAYVGFRQLVAQSYFMQFALVAMAGLSRIHVLAKVRAREIEELYAVLAAWAKRVPLTHADVQAYPAVQVDLPVTLSAALFHGGTLGATEAAASTVIRKDAEDEDDDADEPDGIVARPMVEPEILVSAISDDFWGSG